MFSFHTHFSSSQILKSHHTANNIGSDGAREIAEALKINQSITNVNLTGMNTTHHSLQIDVFISHSLFIITNFEITPHSEQYWLCWCKGNCGGTENQSIHHQCEFNEYEHHSPFPSN